MYTNNNCIQANMHSTHWQPLTQWKRYKSNDDSCTGNVGESPLQIQRTVLSHDVRGAKKSN